MKDKIQNHAVLALALLFVVTTIIGGVWLVHFNQRELETSLREALRVREIQLYELATMTDKNGADEIVTKIITDCSRRSEFEAILLRLTELNRKELLVLQNLEDTCGGFSAERKALMVSKLEHEFQSYSEIANFLLLLSPRDPVLRHVSEWNNLITLEKVRSDLLTEQQLMHENIITVLIQGESAQSSKVQNFVRSLHDITELLAVHDREIDERRDMLMTQ